MPELTQKCAERTSQLQRTEVCSCGQNDKLLIFTNEMPELAQKCAEQTSQRVMKENFSCEQND